LLVVAGTMVFGRTMTDSRLTPLAANLPASVPFVGPEAQERATGRAFTARIGANESVFGPSPAAIRAMEVATGEIWKYADPEAHALRLALASHHGVPPGCIAIDAGIDTLLGLIVRLFVEPGETVVTSHGAYPTLNYHVLGFGGRVETVPYRDDREDPVALLDRAAETGAKLVYICNPDNPMGTWHDAATIEAVIASVPDGCLMILDEAYGDFAPPGTLPPIDGNDPRVIRMRTFSKAYGMAGARVGYAVSHPRVIAGFDRVRNHFGMNRAAQAGALAALGDQTWLAEVVYSTAAARDRIAAIVAANDLSCLPSATNFVTVDCGRDAAFATAVRDALAIRGIFVRMPFATPGNRCIRVGAGSPEDLDRFAEALPGALADADETLS